MNDALWRWSSACSPRSRPATPGRTSARPAPFGLLIVVLLLIGTFLLIWSMNRHLQASCPKSFDRENPEQDQAADDGTVGSEGDTPTTARVRRVSPAESEHARGGHQPVSAPARRQPGALAAVDAGGAGRGGVARRADPAVDRLRGLPLVSRDGPRVVRGRRGGRGDERGVRVHQGRPRGTAGPRRGLHERHRRADRSGRLADDVLPDSRRPAVLLRHVLPESRISCSCSPRSPTPGALGATRSSRPPIRSPVSCGRWRPACPAAGRRCSRRCATTPWPRVLQDEDTARGGFCRRGAEVPAVGATGGAAAQPRTHRRRAAAGGGRTDLHGDGARRHLRPAGRRVRPLQRRRVVGGAALREDALRQRAAAAGVRALGAAHSKPVGAQGGRARRRGS